MVLGPWDSPGKSTGLPFPPPGIFPPRDQTHVLCLRHWQVGSPTTSANRAMVGRQSGEDCSTSPPLVAQQ